MGMDEMVDDGLISDFVAESREHLDAIEPDMLTMEQDGTEVSGEIINGIFRAIHSIKGGAGFLAYENLKKFSHIMESVLMKIRDGELTITPEITDVLLKGVDKLRMMIDDLHESENVECQDEVSRLKVILQLEDQDDAPEIPDRVVADNGETKSALELLGLSIEEAKIAAAHGRNLFYIRVHMQHDLVDKEITPSDFLRNMNSVGECVKTTVKLKKKKLSVKDREGQEYISILFATVLEKELVDIALGIPEDRVRFLNLDATEIQEEEKSASVTEAASPQKSGTIPQVNDNVSKEVVRSEVSETLRVKVSLLTRLMNMAGELVLARNQLVQSMSERLGDSAVDAAILNNIDHVTTEMQEGIMQTRMQPVGTLFGRFSRIVRDLSRELDKRIELQVSGSEIELDKSIIESLSDPLTHIIRNCCDHALETPDERRVSGKEETGTIVLRAFHEGGQVNIAIEDDGRGIDPDTISKIAVDRGVITAHQAEKMSHRDKLKLIFSAGFSTVDTVSEISGRGVGMDVVRSNIEKLGGTVNLESTVGEGTSINLQLPLTLAIIPSIIVGVSNQRYAIPQMNVEEFVWIRAYEVQDRIERIQGQDVLRLRGTLLPLIRLSHVLELKTFVNGHEDRRTRIADRRSADDSTLQDSRKDVGGDSRKPHVERRKNMQSDYNIVVVKIAANRFGIIVDRLFDTEEIVVKPLTSFLKDCPCFSGATILGDGRVITILDIMGITTLARMHFTDVEAEESHRRNAEVEPLTNSSRSVIMFNNAESEFFALPQDDVQRLETIEIDSIEKVGDQEFVSYCGKGLPILRLSDHMNVGPLPEGLSEAYLIIPKMSDGEEAPVGIMVSKIIDALDVDVELTASGIHGAGISGTAMVQEQFTVFLDVDDLLRTVSIG